MCPQEKRTPPYKSKLTPFQDEILKLWFVERQTLKEIKARLEQQGVHITAQGLSKFIAVRRRRPDPHTLPEHLRHLLRKPNGLQKSADAQTVISTSASDSQENSKDAGRLLKNLPTPQEWAKIKARKKGNDR